MYQICFTYVLLTSIKSVQGTKNFPAGDRCRLMVSDGQHNSGFAILASQLNSYVTSGQVSQFCVIQVNRYFCNDIPGNRKVSIFPESDNNIHD